MLQAGDIMPQYQVLKLDDPPSPISGTRRWVASMLGSWSWIQAQPLSFPQKIVQARVYAQGITLASLLGMAALSTIPFAGDQIIQEKIHASEHSWRDVLRQGAFQGRGKPEQGLVKKDEPVKKEPHSSISETSQ